jgi:hypothetical protein
VRIRQGNFRAPNLPAVRENSGTKSHPVANRTSLDRTNQCLTDPIGRGFDAVAGTIDAARDARRETGADCAVTAKTWFINENTNYLIDNCLRLRYMGPTFALARGRQTPTAPPGVWKWQELMTEKKRDYEVGHCKPPVGTRFKKGQSGNPGGRAKKTPPPLLVRKFDEQVVVATNGRRQKTTRREVVIVQLVAQPTGADASVTKMVTDMLKDIDKQAGLSTLL